MRQAFLDAVVRGLSAHPRRLSYRWLYDAEGTALFDAITREPEYYLTRTEAAILEAHAGRLRATVGPATMIELGAGLATKTLTLLRAWVAADGRASYVPIDVSETALAEAVAALAASLPSVACQPIVGAWEDVLPTLAQRGPRVVLFLGSSIGNLEPAEVNAFFARLAASLGPGDHVVLGLDLVKDPERLEAAYDDAAGVTARFTTNLFARMNRELGTTFDVDAIRHVAYWNAELRQIEIYARFERTMIVRVPDAERVFRMARGEMVRIEISRKFVPEEMAAAAAAHGFTLAETFMDADRLFAVQLFRRDAGAAGDDGTRALQEILDRSTRTASPAVAESVAAPSRQMTAAEVQAFFRDVRLVAMATVGAAGQPHMAPVHVHLDGGTLELVVYENTVRRSDVATNARVGFTAWNGTGAVVIAYGRAVEVPDSLRPTRPGRSGAPRRVVTLRVALSRVYAMRPPSSWPSG